ncbi:hypothetical protein D5282_14010 [bacterium 1xD8-48]|nr:hypothetical protein [bacterium 1xD8-48]
MYWDILERWLFLLAVMWYTGGFCWKKALLKSKAFFFRVRGIESVSVRCAGAGFLYLGYGCAW